MKKIIFILALCVLMLSCSPGGVTNKTTSATTVTDALFTGTIDSQSNAIGFTYPAADTLVNNSPSGIASWGTATWALGANYSDSYIQFAVYAPNATKMLLEIYNYATGYDAAADYWMAKGTDGIWRAKIYNTYNGRLYGFRAWGPNWTYNASWVRGNSSLGFISDVDSAGNRFNPNKVLFDPYAKELSHDKTSTVLIAAGQDNGMFGTGSALYKGIVRRTFDTGKWAPKGYTLKPSIVSFGTKPAIAQKDAIIYEAHVRGLTNSTSTASLTTILTGMAEFATVLNIPAAYVGTYKGAGYMAKYLKGLGFNTIELLPVQETDNDSNSAVAPGGNFWGYMTYGYFAPDRRYSYNKTYGGPTDEFRAMVKSFHDAGMEVYLDTVYNHTGEGGTWGTADTRELTCFAGFANNSYYRLTADNQWYYDGTTGCGNQLNCTNTATRNLVSDSLKYWITTMGVDGFRFDLAPVIARNANNSYNFDPYNQPVITDITNMISTYNVEMIAEAWDCNGSYVSGFPPAMGDWNGDYRDVVRKFIKGDGYKPGTYYSFGDVFYGTYNGYYDGGAGGPHKSINFLVAHDGFTLADLVSYNSKQNVSLTFPFGPSDGGNDNNLSWDCGGNQALRRQQLRNLWTIQMFSRGTPMVVYGDEFGRTQDGNNNPYNLDSVSTWNNYTMINTDTPQTRIAGQHNNLGTDAKIDSKNNIFMFAKYVTNTRATSVALRQASYTMPVYIKKENGTTDLANTDKCVWIRIGGSSVADSDYLLFINSYSASVNFTIPVPVAGKKWVRIIDTATWAEANDNCWAPATGWSPANTTPYLYGVAANSVVVLKQL